MLNTQAPDFTLEASTGQKITLQDLRGSYVVLIFYPANDTPVCNSQLEEASMHVEKFVECNARVFGVNTASTDKHREYCTRKRLDFPILSDTNAQTAKKYKAYWGWLPVNRRTVVVIDPEGKIVMYERGKPSTEEILSHITPVHQKSV